MNTFEQFRNMIIDFAAIGIIGGADGPTAVCLTHPIGEASRLRMAS